MHRRVGSTTMSWLAFSGGKQPEYPTWEMPLGQYSSKKILKKSCKHVKDPAIHVTVRWTVVKHWYRRHDIVNTYFDLKKLVAERVTQVVSQIMKWNKSNINQTSFPTPFYSVLVSFSVFMAISTVFHSINSPDGSPFSHSVVVVLALPYWSFQLYISLWESPSALI